MTTEKINEEVKEEKPAEEQAPEPELTLEEKVANLEAGMKQTIIVCNNLITYCNTMEKWRKMDFVPQKDESEADSDNSSEESEAPAEKSAE